MDFDSLKTKGFSFVKLDADVFLEGMPAPGGRFPRPTSAVTWLSSA